MKRGLLTLVLTVTAAFVGLGLSPSQDVCNLAYFRDGVITSGPLIDCGTVQPVPVVTTTQLWDADATQDLTLLGSSGANSTIVSDIKHGGHAKSLRIFDAGSDGADFNNANNAAGRVSFYIYVVAFPGSSNSTFFLTDTAQDGGSDLLKWRLDNVGVLRLFPGGGGGQIGADASIALTTGSWIRVTWAWTISSTTVNASKLWINGVQAFSMTNATLGTATGMQFFFIGTNGDTACDYRISDVMIDNSNSLSDIASDVWVTSKRPNANGSLNEYTTQIGAGGSGYGSGHSPQVNELPLSTTNGWSITNAAKKTEEYSVEGASTGQIDISAATLIDWGAWVYTKVGSASTGNIIVGGTASNISVTTAYKVFQAFKGSTTYPAGNNDVGVDTNTVNQLFSLAECGVMVAYTPGAAMTVGEQMAARQYGATQPQRHRPQVVSYSRRWAARPSGIYVPRQVAA